MNRIKPGEKMPEVPFRSLNCSVEPRSQYAQHRYTMRVFYRGVQCSYCKKHIQSLYMWLPEFRRRDVKVIAVSADTRSRAEQARREWALSQLDLGYDLDVEAARRLGLFVSTAKRKAEMDKFCEPGVFLVNPDNTLFTAWLQAYPHARPNFEEILECIDFIEEYKKPPRGDA